MLGWLRCLIAALAAWCVLGTGTVKAAGDNYKVVAYYISWGVYERNFTPENITAKNLTHINYAFANIRNGEVVLGDPYADTRTANNFGKLRHLRERNPHA